MRFKGGWNEERARRRRGGKEEGGWNEERAWRRRGEGGRLDGKGGCTVRGGGGGGREDLFLVSVLVTLNECWYQLCWGEVLAHLYPGLHCLGGTLTHEGRRELVEQRFKSLEATASLLRRMGEWREREEGRKRRQQNHLSVHNVSIDNLSIG